MEDDSRYDLVLFSTPPPAGRQAFATYLDGLRVRLRPGTPLPHTLLAAVDRDSAERIHAELERLGAEAAILPAVPPAGRSSHEAPIPAPPEPHASPSVPDRERTGGGLAPLLVTVALVGAAVYWQVEPIPTWYRALRPRPPLVERPVASRLERIAARSGPPLAVELNNEAVHAAANGDPATAVARLEEARRVLPDDPVLTRNLQTVLLNWALDDLASERLDDASAHLERAAELGERPEVTQAIRLLSARAAEQHRAADARLAGTAHDGAGPGELIALGELYLKQDKRAQAFDVLQRAKEIAPQIQGLDTMLERLGREVDAEWDFVQLRSPHFTVSFGDNADQTTVQVILEILEEAYDSVGNKLGHQPDGETPVVLYTRQDFHAITETPDWAGGVYDGRIKIPVGGMTAYDPGVARALRHEFAHHVVTDLAGPRCPAWLNEGLAVWAEEPEDADRAAWARIRLARTGTLRLGALQGAFRSLPPEWVEAAYSQSYLAVQTLVEDYGAERMRDMLAAIKSGDSVEAAFARTYPENLQQFEKRLAAGAAGPGG